jgi:hypothetical protein
MNRLNQDLPQVSGVIVAGLDWHSGVEGKNVERAFKLSSSLLTMLKT